MTQYKTCSRCKQVKDRSSFAKGRKNADGLQGYCKACQKEVRLQNLERDREYQIRYKAENREILLAKKRVQGKKYYAKNREQVLARQKANFYLDKAKMKGFLRRTRLQNNATFLVTKRDIEKMRKQLCIYCNKRQADSIDHIIPISRGGSHGIGNLVGCCKSCNSSKGTKTIMEWKKVRGW